MHLEIWQLAAAAFAAYGIGLAKTGITGVGIVSIALFAAGLGSSSIGIVLPLLVIADCIAVLAYRRHAVWSHLWQLFPWAAVGIILGWLAMKHIHAHQVSQLIGGLLLLLTLMQFVQRVLAVRRKTQYPEEETETLPVGILASGGMITIALGILAGFTTMVANAAGPLMVLYLLAARLPKMEFVGTGAWYYFCLNLFKVPFSLQLGQINPGSLHLDLLLVPFAIAGALSGRALLPHIHQRLFENLALFFTALASLYLLCR